MTQDLSRQIPIEKIEKKGYQTTIEISEDEKDALIKRFDLHSIADFHADIKIMPHTAAYHVTGIVKATVEQISVVSGNPVSKIIQQDIDAWFSDQSKIAFFEQEKNRRDSGSDDHEVEDEKDTPDPIVNGMIDIGEICTEFFGLALDTYPRGDDEDFGDYIEVDEKDAKPNPFAVLGALKDK